MGQALPTPLFYRVEEAAEILRISRSTAYEMANAWLRSDGADGLPCLKLGRRIVVPRAVIDGWATIGTDQPGHRLIHGHGGDEGHGPTRPVVATSPQPTKYGPVGDAAGDGSR